MTEVFYSCLEHLRLQGGAMQPLQDDARHSDGSPFAAELSSAGSGGDDNSSSQGGPGGGPVPAAVPSTTAGMALSAPQLDLGGIIMMDPSPPKSSQICFDYTKGLCTRGDKCKYSHDLATIVHFNSREKGICFDYLRNQCHRGLLCRFSHDLSNIAQQCQTTSEVFSTQQATAKQGNKTNAICYDFVKGVCQRGNDCRYSHDLSLIARTARGGQQAHKSVEVCYDYLRGRCNRGSSCKYSHNIPFPATSSFLPGGPPHSNGGSASGPGPGPMPIPTPSMAMSSAGMPNAQQAISVAAAAVAASAAASGGGGPFNAPTPASSMPMPLGSSVGGHASSSVGGLGSAAAHGGSLVSSQLLAGLTGSVAARRRLASSVSADPLVLASSTSPANLQAALTSSLSSSISPDMDGSHPLNSALSQEPMDGLPDASSWAVGARAAAAASGHTHGTAAAAHVRALAAVRLAQQRRQQQLATAMAQGFGSLQVAHMMAAAVQHQGGSVGFLHPAVQQQVAAAASEVNKNMLAYHHHQQALACAFMQGADAGNSAAPPVSHPPAASSPLSAPGLTTGGGSNMTNPLSALLANFGDNPQLLAETLSALSATQAACMLSEAQHLQQPGLHHAGSAPADSLLAPSPSAPQPIPGRGYDHHTHAGVASPPLSCQDRSLATGAAAAAAALPGPELLSRTAPNLPIGRPHTIISPDLLPLLKEIWNK